MKDYRETMRDLSFTREQKDAMVDRLLAETPQTAHHRPRKRMLGAVAALLVLTITACAAGGFQVLAQIAANIIDPNSTEAQAQTIEELFTPIGISDTDNGVTITVEGVAGDTNSISVLYSITRDSGDPLISPSEETARVSNGDNFLFFEEDTTYDITGQSTIGSIEFLDFDVSDPTLYFLETWVCPSTQVDLNKQMEATFENLYSHEIYVSASDELIQNKIPLVQGTWKLAFDLDYEPMSTALPTGQTFHYKEVTGTITAIRISPLSIHLEYDYTIDEDTLLAGYDPSTVSPQGITKENWLENERYFLLADSAMYLSLTFTDGTTSPLFLQGDISQEGHAIVSDTFETIYPLDTIESITIGDLTIPVEAP